MIKRASGITKAGFAMTLSRISFRISYEFDPDPLNGATRVLWHGAALCQRRVMKLARWDNLDFLRNLATEFIGRAFAISANPIMIGSPLRTSVSFHEEYGIAKPLVRRKSSFPNHLAFFLPLASPSRLTCRVTCIRSLQKRPITRKAALGNNNPAVIPRT